MQHSGGGATVRISRLLAWLREVFWALPDVRRLWSKPMLEGRDRRIKALESKAAAVEGRNRELEGRLAFKKREAEVMRRVQEASSRKDSLWERLGDYGVRRPRLLRWVLIGVGALLFVVMLTRC